MSVTVLNIDPQEGIGHFRLSGKIYHDNAQELKAPLSRAIRKEVTELVIDCEDLVMIDSSGLSVIVNLIKELSNQSGRLHFCDLNESVEEVFELTNLKKFVEIHEDTDEAIDFIKS